MKKLVILMAVVALSISVLPKAAMAGSEFDPVADVFPVHLVSYVVFPIGLALEWAIFRPLHLLVSAPYVSDVFGHRVNDGVNRAEFTSHY